MQISPSITVWGFAFAVQMAVKFENQILHGRMVVIHILYIINFYKVEVRKVLSTYAF